MSTRGRPRARIGAEAFDVKVTVMFPATERERLARMAEADGITYSELLRKILRQEWLRRQKGPAQP